MKTPKVTDVRAEKDYMLSVCFENGMKKTFDAKPLLTMPIYQPLADEAVFRNVRVDLFGGITWGNDMDCCCDTLYEDGVRQEDVAV